MDFSISDVVSFFVYAIVIIAVCAISNLVIIVGVYFIHRTYRLIRPMQNNLVQHIRETIGNNGGVHYVEPPKMLLDVVHVINPFHLDIDIATASYYGIHCNMRSELDCYIIELWGCSYGFLLELMTSSWTDLQYAISTSIEQGAVVGRFVCYNAGISLSANAHARFVFELPQGVQVSDITRNEICNRSFYPLVLITVLRDTALDNDRIVVATATAIHLPDPLNPAPSYVISQIMMQANGISGVLKDTFAVSYEPDDTDAEPEHICTICYERHISIVILPCGHASMCHTCFNLVDRCPICRRPIQSYFHL